MDADLARVFANLTTGIYVLTVAEGSHHHGMSSSWVTQVSGVPLLFMAAIDTGHRSRAVIAKTGAFGLNLVGMKGRALEDYFLSTEARRPDNLNRLDYDLSPSLRVPWLKLAIASIEARVIATTITGDHTLFIAEPAGVRVNNSDRPLTSLDLDYVYLGGRDVVRREGK
jgi:flavin reductase (DIM6/NTAB) family NADH-FMN oxidoreductase RutF